ncbi:MAG TPA: hypothetical protein PK648_14855 [Verrucomicrobiales bacterium]|nr:hypothetical protein [Verrucomicrobiales bacterium]
MRRAWDRSRARSESPEASGPWSRVHPEVIVGFLKVIPMGRFGEPEDLGPLAVYLATDVSR